MPIAAFLPDQQAAVTPQENRRALGEYPLSPIVSNDGTVPPGAASASGGISPAALAWIVAFGFLALVGALVGAVVVALRHRSNHAESSA